MPGIFRSLQIPGFRAHGRFFFVEYPHEQDGELLNGEFVAFVEDHDLQAASEICTRLEAGERIVPLPRRDLYRLDQERRSGIAKARLQRQRMQAKARRRR